MSGDNAEYAGWLECKLTETEKKLKKAEIIVLRYRVLLEALTSMPDVEISFKSEQQKNEWISWRRSVFTPEGKIRVQQEESDERYYV